MAVAGHAHRGPHIAQVRVPEPVVEHRARDLVDRAGRVRQRQTGLGAGGQRQPHEIGLGQRERVVQRQVGQLGDAVVFDLPIPQRPGMLGVVQHHGLEQKAPVRRHVLCAVASGIAQVGCPIIQVGAGEHLPVMADPLAAAQAGLCRAIGVPAGGRGSSEAVQHLLRAGQRQVVGIDFDHQHDDVDIEKEVQIDMLDMEVDRAAVGKAHPAGRHIGAAKYTDGRLAIAHLPGHRLRLTVQKPLHMGQKGRELPVMALLEFSRVDRELIGQFGPGVEARAAIKIFPVAGHFPVQTLDRHQLQGPHQDLPEVAYERIGARTPGRGHSSRQVARVVHARGRYTSLRSASNLCRLGR